MKIRTGKAPGRMWSVGWVLIIRFILYLVIISFFLQYIYFGEKGQFYLPNAAIIQLLLAFFVNLVILLVGGNGKWQEQCIALTYIIDLMVLTHVTLSSGGFNSVFIPYFLPILVMATAWLPRQFTAVFPSIATLGAAYIGFAHLQVSAGEIGLTPGLYPYGMLDTLRYSHPHTVVATMLILTVLFFVISYLSGMLSDRLFLEQRLNVEVLASMKEGVAVVNQTGELLYVNSEFERIFPGAKPGANFSSTAETLLQPDGAGPSLSNLLLMDLSETITVTREGGGGDSVPPLEIRISGIRPRGRYHLYALVFLVSDLTLRRRVERAERNLERFSAISTMSAGLAHEIRNPLASLRSAIQEIGRSFPEGSQDRILTNVVIAESDRLDGIIGRFLDFSREGQLRLTKTHLGELLADIRTIIQHDPQGMAVVLEIRDDPEVLCDADRIKQVFLNLALNAAQATPSPGGELTITMGLASKDGIAGVEILFEDNGPGIAEETLARMFEPFFSNKPGGTGMGLPLSRKQVGMHGGEIEAANGFGGGAFFRIWLPLDPPRVTTNRGNTRIIRSSRASIRK